MKVQANARIGGDPPTVSARVRRGRRIGPLRLAVLAVVALLIVAVPIAWASDVFSDVPDNHPFHDDINAIAFAGITTGCTATEYCPQDFVRRQAMAAFLNRGLGRVKQYISAGSLLTVTGTSVDDGPRFTTTFTPGLPPGALPGATGYVKVDAVVSLFAGEVEACPCTYRVAIHVGGLPIHNWYGTADVMAGDQRQSIPVTGVFEVTSPGPKTIQIRVFRSAVTGTGTSSAGAGIDLTATYFPFGEFEASGLPAGQAAKASDDRVPRLTD